MNKEKLRNPEITFENLDVSELTSNDIPEDGMFYDGICIPLKFNNADQLAWEFVWDWFNDRYVEQNGEDDTIKDQPIDLQLYIEDNPVTDKRSYTLSAFIKINHYGEITTECMTKKIMLCDREKNAVDLALLKLINPKKYFLKYTRYQVATSEKILNKDFGFVMDQIDENDMYKSVWISQNHSICLICCIENVHNKNSKLQVLKVG